MHGAPSLGALDHAGSRQHVEMLDHRRQRHVERSGDLRHRQLAVVCEPVEDRAPRRVSQRGERTIELDIAKVNHIVKYLSALSGRQGGTLHNRVHEATGEDAAWRWSRIGRPGGGPARQRRQQIARTVPGALEACLKGFSHAQDRVVVKSQCGRLSRLLRKCSEGPGDRRAAEQRDEFCAVPFDCLVRPRADANKGSVLDGTCAQRDGQFAARQRA
jgi:hypothetical protein